MVTLLAAAESHSTAALKKIQRHQRTQLLLAQRNRDRRKIAFFQPRVDAVAQVLNNRKAGA